jgi:hypothetical protein
VRENKEYDVRTSSTDTSKSIILETRVIVDTLHRFSGIGSIGCLFHVSLVQVVERKNGQTTTVISTWR